MRINFFKEKNKIKLNKNHNFDSDNTFSNENPESNKCLASISDDEYDHYGFEKSRESIYAEDIDKEALEKRKRKIEKKWQQYFAVKRDIKKNYYLKKLIRKGIPDKFRMNIWPYLLGSVVLYTKYPTIYERCLNSEIEPKVLSQIELDMLRTFPHNKNSMNFIAAITLLFLKEELAFWSIVQLIDSDYSHKKINISDYYNHEMRGLRRDIIVIEELIKIKFPNVHMHMKEFDVDVSWICSEWLLCLFCTAFPIATTLRIWDCLFYEGDKILFRIVLALFKMNQEKLIKSNSLESILYIFKESTKNMVESDKLMHTAFKEIGSLKKKKIKKLRMKADDIIKRTAP
ncbi:GTPase-activating protein, putative [Plasmodium berghei ANKA]|uniref:GTPase-activating protein, putative n=1 Tax=Plasmodium berghei (strain Anka) TaxID=5823 RepID=A0A509AM38_PLABA|nr:GTPase-activating protein, putative [Plasmodium berghei ANKA]VUC55875.1 GTPase-activating protein, putative [Plasmodium berghei ANKA]|eukprot:XP_034421685.1 GTPase-activating protein, putative [Plasmodium berghei ANKA]